MVNDDKIYQTASRSVILPPHNLVRSFSCAIFFNLCVYMFFVLSSLYRIWFFCRSNEWLFQSRIESGHYLWMKWRWNWPKKLSVWLWSKAKDNPQRRSHTLDSENSAMQTRLNAERNGQNVFISAIWLWNKLNIFHELNSKQYQINPKFI